LAAADCTCGYRAGGPDGEPASLLQTANEEELFETYLSARLNQAIEELNAARLILTQKPGDLNQAVHVMRRVQELRTLQNELRTQRARLAEARIAAGLEPLPPPGETAAESAPRETFRASQAEQAAKIMAALAQQPRTCPSCQALLTDQATQCHCGYRLSAVLTTKPESDTLPATPTKS
jgi:hypothetical protein